MSKNLHDIDKLFGDALNDHEELPSFAVWEAIDKSLDKKNITDIKRKYAKLKAVAAGLLILLIGAGILNIQLNNKHKNIAEKNEETINKQPSKIKSIQDLHAANKAIDIVKNNQAEVAINIVAKQGYSIKNNANEKLPAKKDAEKNSVENLNGKMQLINYNNNNISASLTNDISGSNSATAAKQKKSGRINKSGRQKITMSAIDIEEAADNEMTDAGKVIVDKNELITFQKNQCIKPERVPGFIDKSSVLATFVTRGSLSNLKPVQYSFNSSSCIPVKKKSNNTKTARFSITAFFAPNIPSFRLENDHDERRNRIHDESGKIKQEEQHQQSSSFGLLADYTINRHWAIQSGLTFTEKKINIQPKKLFADKDDDGNIQFRFNCSSGYAFVPPKAGIAPIIGDSIQTNRSTTHLQYSSIPLSIKYNYSYKKITLFAVAGTAINFLAKGNIKTEVADNYYSDKNSSTKINGLKSSNFSGAAGLGVEYYFFRKIALTFMPTYHFALTSITQNSTVKSYPNSLSLAAGLHYRF